MYTPFFLHWLAFWYKKDLHPIFFMILQAYSSHQFAAKQHFIIAG